MNALDVILVLGALLAVIGGVRLGFATRVVSWLGLGIGLLIGVRVLPVVLGHLQGADRFQLVLVAVAVVLTGAVLGQAAGLALSNRISPGRRHGTVATIDRVLGGLAGLIGMAVLVWLLFPLLATTPGWLSDATAHSTIANAFAQHLPTAPDSSQIARALVGPSQFPEVLEELSPPSETIDPPGATGLSPAVAAATARSTVKVEGISCQRIVDGSGFVVGPGLVVTNAHVVAGERSTGVLRDDGRRLTATVVSYDPERDLALLSVPDIGRPPLALADPSISQTGGVFGHPGGAPLRIAPFEIVRQITAVGKDIYGSQTTHRQVLELAAALAPGDSGSAVVAGNGQVVGVAFAVSTTRATSAYALAPSELRSVLAEPHAAPVSTGSCTA